MVTEQNKVGEILYTLRREKGIGQENLSRGLCSKGNYSKYEYGNRRPDRLVLNALLQRLGKNPDKLATVLSFEEYRYLCWKKKVLEAVAQEKPERLRKLLAKPEATTIPIHQELQRQFFYQMQAVLAEQGEVCIALLEQAVELTMPGILQRGMGRYLISAEEMGILLRLVEALLKNRQEKRAERLLLEIVEYADRNYDDCETKIKIYPKAVKLLIPLLMVHQRELEGMVFCKKAIEMLRRQGVLYDLAELLEYYLWYADGFPETEEKAYFEKQLQALKEIYLEYGADVYWAENTLLSYSSREIYLIDELIKRRRMEKSMSQERLSEGICAPETLSRIESGKHTPNSRNFRALMRKLDTDLDYYNGELDTNDFLLLEEKAELERAISLKHWERARELLEALKAKLDMDSPRNKRTISAEENCILYNTGSIGDEVFLAECEKALDCKGEGWREEQFWKQFFTRDKVKLLNHIAAVYHSNHQNEKSIFILEHLLEQLLGSRVKLADRYKSSMLVLGNLSSYYGEMGRCEDCLRICEIGIALCLECGRGTRFGKILGNKAEALNDKAGSATEKSRQYLTWAYFISDLMHTHGTSAYTDKYYRSHYEADIVWY